MFKAARNRLVDKGALTKDDAPSYFIECLLYNVPDHLFEDKLAPTYTGILDWLKTAKLNDVSNISWCFGVGGPTTNVRVRLAQ